MTKPVLLLMCGSLRAASTNALLLDQAVGAFGDAEVLKGNLDLPLFNADVEADATPEGAKTLVDQVARADALLIGSPEYNKGISGPLKNAIDWLSRADPSVLAGKMAVIMSAAAGRTGGETAHFMTHSILTQLQVNVVNGPLILVAAAHEAFDDGGQLKSNFYRGQVEDRMAKLKALLG
jgi:chromate reductase